MDNAIHLTIRFAGRSGTTFLGSTRKQTIRPLAFRRREGSIF